MDNSSQLGLLATLMAPQNQQGQSSSGGNAAPMNLQQALMANQAQQLSSTPTGLQNTGGETANGASKLLQALMLNHMMQQSPDPDSAQISDAANQYGQMANSQVASMPIAPIPGVDD